MYSRQEPTCQITPGLHCAALRFFLCKYCIYKRKVGKSVERPNPAYIFDSVIADDKKDTFCATKTWSCDRVKTAVVDRQHQKLLLLLVLVRPTERFVFLAACDRAVKAVGRRLS